MRDESEIREALSQIKADERLSYPDARIDINAPLALIQLSLKTAVSMLEWCLGEADHEPTGVYKEPK